MEPYYDHDGITIYHGDCREVLPTLEPVDLVLTDPPYPKEFLHVWDYLNDVRCDAGFLVTLLGHYQLPHVVSTLCRTWEYFWCAVTHNNNCPIMHGLGIKVTWKPALVFRRGGASTNGIWRDNFLKASQVKKWRESSGRHKWGQTETLFYEPLRAFVPDGGRVLDPFLGGGTVLRVCKDMGISAIGIEIEERYCEIAAERLRQGVLPFQI